MDEIDAVYQKLGEKTLRVNQLIAAGTFDILLSVAYF
jgi:hypothetical protein